MISRSTLSRLLAVGVLALLSGCKEDAPVEPAPGGNTTGTTTLATLYDTAPNVGSCSEGTLKQTERQKVMSYLNAIRANHGLAPVQYRAEDDGGTAKAALIIAASEKLDHQPASSTTCWSQAGFAASGLSNLAIGSSSSTTLLRTSESFIDMWIRDETVVSLGHRRWLLDPFLKFISFGRVDKVTGTGTVSGSAIQVIYNEYQTLTASTPDFVAFPFHETSSTLFGSNVYMSFSVLADRNDFWSNQDVDYGGATITIRTESGQTVPATVVNANNETYGLANILVWTAPVANDTRYLVTIAGVDVGGVAKSYEYWFTTKTTV